ncbi:MAG: 3-dehydroquinate synthase, partial [bacterium]|nr:3-dehydroquinate synthase [bacterium]
WGQPLLHGEAVSIGMIAALRLSEHAGVLESQQRCAIESHLEAISMPTRIPAEAKLAAIIGRLRYDKKCRGGSIDWTLLAGAGEALFEQQVALQAVTETLQGMYE